MKAERDTECAGKPPQDESNRKSTPREEGVEEREDRDDVNGDKADINREVIFLPQHSYVFGNLRVVTRTSHRRTI